MEVVECWEELLHDESSLTLTQKLTFSDEVEELSTLAVSRGGIEQNTQMLLTTYGALLRNIGNLLKYKEAAFTPFPNLMQLDDVGVILNYVTNVRISSG